jgi:membrane protein YqaA with SNARE-associated domain
MVALKVSMHAILHSLAHFFFHLGGMGLLLLGTLDSSFLMLPLGNDLLLVALVAAHRGHFLYYVLMATAGSTIGVAFAHLVSSRTGLKAIEGEHKSRTIAYVERKVEKYGGLAIGIAALAPPGFPFTPFIVVPAALQYPRNKMLLIIAGCRLVRFLVEGWLALIYGRRLIQLANSPWLQHGLLVLAAISRIGSVFSIWGWVQKGRQKG